MELSKRLKTLRKASKLSLRAASKQCGCSFQYLQKLESGESIRPAMDLLYTLASVYDFAADTLILEAEKIPSDVYWKIIRNPELLAQIRFYQPV